MDARHSTVTCNRPRTMFTEEQKLILKEAYEKGVNSVNKNQAEAIRNLASQVNCDVEVIKVRM